MRMPQGNDMKNGRFTQTVWQRSVRKKLHIKKEEAIWDPSPWEMCSGFETEEGPSFVWADTQVSGYTARTGYYAVYHAAGELAAKGISAAGVAVRILLPERSSEECLSDLAEEIQRACSELEIRVTSLDGEVTDGVSRIIVFASAAGTALKGMFAGNVSPREHTGQEEILLCGYAGLEGTLRILETAGEELEARFVSSFLAQAETLTAKLVRPKQLLNATERHVTAMRQIGRGGIFAALWELSGSEGTGFEIDLERITLKQETVEICEHYRLNPYLMTSAGSYLILTREAQAVRELLEQSGVTVAGLGVSKTQNARVIRNGEEIRYLDRPARDELDRWQSSRIKAAHRKGGREVSENEK